MNFKRGMLWVTATVATAAVIGLGSVTVVGCNRSDADEAPGIGNEQAAQEMVGGVEGDATETASNGLGVEQYRGGSHSGGSRGSHAGSHSGSHASRSFGHTHGGGYAHGGRGFGHGYGRGGHWGGSRWGRWGGGRYVGNRWVAGPYYGWCDDRYYACNRYWW
jgi:hypothetical protein